MTTLQDKVFAVILTVITLVAFFGWLAIIASTLTFETKMFLSVFVMPLAFIVLAISSLKLIDLLIKE
jgi:amino acid permease